MSNRAPFAVVASMRDRLSVVGSEDVLRVVLPKASPSSILPSDWSIRGYGCGQLIWNDERGPYEALRD